MPTVKPRLNVALEPRAYAAVRSLAEVSGVSMSSIVAEHVEAVCSVMERTAELMALGLKAQGERREAVAAIVDRSAAALEPLEARAVQILVGMVGELSDEAAGGRSERAKPAGRAPGPAGPPPSNYGGQVPSRKAKRGGRRGSR